MRRAVWWGAPTGALLIGEEGKSRAWAASFTWTDDFRPRPPGGPRRQRPWKAVPTRQGCMLHVEVKGTEPKRLCLQQALVFTFCLSQEAPDTGGAIFPMATVLSPCREGQAGVGRQAQCPHAQTNTCFSSSLVWKSLYGSSTPPPPRPPTPTVMWRPLALRQ